MKNTNKFYSVGIDIGGTKIAIGLADEKGTLLSTTEFPTQGDGGIQTLVNRITVGIKEMMLAGGQIKAIGIGVPGQIDPDSGKIFKAPNIPGLNKLNLKQLFSKHFNCPVHLDNDANAAGWAERIYGAGRGYNNIVFLTISTGIGAAIIIDGKLHVGTHFIAGEVGHMTMQINGPRCGCGRAGCFEAIASGTALARRTQELIKLKPKTKDAKELLKLSGGNPRLLTAPIIAQVACKGNKLAQLQITLNGEYLGYGIANIINIIDPEIVILGGGLMKIGQPLWKPLRQVVAEYSLARPVPRIVSAQLSTNAGVLGAVALGLK